MDKPKWTLYIWWNGEWRRLWGSEKRVALVEYAEGCPEEIQLRIMDSEEEKEVKKYGR